MRYLHEELLEGFEPKGLLTQDDDEIRRRAVERAEGETHALQLFWIAVGLRNWMRDGRRVVYLSPLTVAALDDTGPVPPRTFRPRCTVEVVLEERIEIVEPKLRLHGARVGQDYGVVDHARCIVQGALLMWDGTQTVAITAMHVEGEPLMTSRTYSLDDDEAPGDARLTNLLRAIVRALADERTHWIEPRPKRNRTQSRKDKKAGLDVGRLVLSEDALNVWRRRHLMEHEREGAAGVVRGPVSPHEVRPHLCRQWVLEPEPGEVIVEDKLHRAAKDGKPAVWLYCVRRERRGHVRGGGEVRAKVERVVPCL